MTCETCDGLGVIEDPDFDPRPKPFIDTITCPDCNGMNHHRRMIRVVKHGPLPSASADTLVVFQEDPMTYICVFGPDDRMKLPADSIRILGRVAEFERAYQEHIESLGF